MRSVSNLFNSPSNNTDANSTDVETGKRFAFISFALYWPGSRKQEYSQHRNFIN